MKKLLALVLSLAMSLSLATSALSSYNVPFADVTNRNHWAFESIARAQEDGIVKGAYVDPDNGEVYYLPSKTLTKAEFAAIMTRAFLADKLSEKEAEFASAEDMDQRWYNARWFATNIAVAEENGLLPNTYQTLLADYNNTLNDAKIGHMGPDGTMYYSASESLVNAKKSALSNYVGTAIPRYEMALMIAKIAELNGCVPNETAIETAKKTIGDFATITATQPTYADAVATVFALGVITGVDSHNTFAGESSVTRAQAAVIYCRLADIIAGK